jgi:hypothetical protein
MIIQSSSLYPRVVLCTEIQKCDDPKLQGVVKVLWIKEVRPYFPVLSTATEASHRSPLP